jgi:hypothetical protein
MVKTLYFNGVVAGVLLVSCFFCVQYAQADESDEPCGHFIAVEGGVQYSEAINDCEVPFGDDVNTEPPFQVSFGTIQIEDKGVYPIAGSFSSLDRSKFPSFSFSRLYKHQGDDYLLIASQNQSFTFATGTYSLHITGGSAPVVTQNIQQKLFAYLVQTAHAAEGSSTLITFTVTDPLPPEPVVDELILKYAPILYFHPQEDYFPMDVESFVEASALWNQDGTDVQIHSSEALTFKQFESLITSGVANSDTYLAFSEPDTKKSIHIENARVVYENLLQADEYSPTIYYSRMKDGEYIVLQYWYFYAMNNWGEKVGGLANNHEGDWESTFVFLNEDENPVYVAYSSHLNDGVSESLNLFQYDSVRRAWNSDEVIKNSGKVVSFVSLGSHANYPNNNGGEHNVRGKIDKTSMVGRHLEAYTLSDIDTKGIVWDRYEGKWGADTLAVGEDGPQGPRFIDVTGQVRSKYPVQWAGIDKIVTTILTEEQIEVLFLEQEVSIAFDAPVSGGTFFEVAPHNEVITFGLVPDDSHVLPHFWDIESSLENKKFDAQLTLPYSLKDLQSLGYAEEDIVGAYYNPLLNTWTYLPATFDSATQTAKFNISHFSRYALAAQHTKNIEEPDTSEVLATNTKEHNYGTRVGRQKGEVLGTSTSSVSVDELQKVVIAIGKLVQKYPDLDVEQKAILRNALEDISILMKFL